MAKSDQYPIFVHWYKTLDWILDKCEKMPRHQRFTLSGRIANLGLEVQEGIIAAIYTRERKPILRQVNLELEKLRVLFRICYDRRYISERQYAYVAAQLEETGKMVGGWSR